MFSLHRNRIWLSVPPFCNLHHRFSRLIQLSHFDCWPLFPRVRDWLCSWSSRHGVRFGSDPQNHVETNDLVTVRCHETRISSTANALWCSIHSRRSVHLRLDSTVQVAVDRSNLRHRAIRLWKFHRLHVYNDIHGRFVLDICSQRDSCHHDG